MFDTIGCLILAAGKGTRMYSDEPKVLRVLLGEPMLGCVYAALGPLFKTVNTVVGHGAEKLRAVFPHMSDSFVLQAEQLGTGHALQTAWQAISPDAREHWLVVNGDTPLIESWQIKNFIDKALAAKADLAFISLSLADPGSFGRVGRNAAGEVGAIIEAKDFDPALHGGPCNEINAGIYLLKRSVVEPLLGQLNCENKSREYYITDLVGLCVAQGFKVVAENLGGDPNLLGVNSPAELVQAEEVLRERIATRLLASGVLLRDSKNARIGPLVKVAPGAEICAPCEITGACEIETAVLIEPFCVIKNSIIRKAACVRSFSHLEQAEVGELANVGPYARLRPGAVLKTKAKVGNFVEMKKAVLGENAKASHLTYLGDAEVGADANIGAGTITCNYDGKNKHFTSIGSGAFIGSNTALVAPVKIGENALVGAGSVITKDVPDRALGIARERQRNIEGWGK